MAPRRIRSLTSILMLLAAFLPSLAVARPLLGEAVTPSRLGPTYTAAVDPQILEEIAASPQGRTGFFVLFREQADLSPAYAIDDWARRGQFVVEALQHTAARSQARVRAWLEARSIDYRSFLSSNALFVTGDAALLSELATFAEVAALRANHVHPLDTLSAAADTFFPEGVTWNIAQVGADRVWDEFGVKGQGIIVAHIDTGVEYTHDALFPNYKCGNGPHADCWSDPTNVCPTAPCDDGNRGTHLMGVMVGDEDPGLTYTVGMAPDAQWIACKGCSGASCPEFALNACADWMLAPNGNPANRPHVISLALNSLQKCDGFFLPQIMAWRAAGIFTSARGGSEGPDCDTMRAPGSYEGILASGPTDQNDLILPSSSRGPGCAGGIKPDVAAPGASICSAYPGNTWYCGYSGTSFSTAHSAGLAALLYSADPGLIGHHISTTLAITSTALCIEDLSCGGTPCPDGANNVYGWGRIDAYAAVAALLQPCEPVHEADFSWEPLTPRAGQAITLTATASGTLPITFTWDLGDGTPAQGQIITHTYDQPGTYTIVLTATNCQTATAVVSHALTVTELPCEAVVEADFSWEPLTPTVGQVVTLTGWANRWFSESVDGFCCYFSLDLDTAGHPHVSLAFPNRGALHIYYDGTTWQIQGVGDPNRICNFCEGCSTSLVMDIADRPHISCADPNYLDFDLEYAYHDGAGWHTEVVDGGNAGLFSSLVLDSAGRPHLSYCRCNAPTGTLALKYAYYDGTGWISETVDGDLGQRTPFHYTSLALDTAGRAHIAYFGREGVKYAWQDSTSQGSAPLFSSTETGGASWQIETVDWGAVVSLALDAADRPHLAYCVDDLTPNRIDLIHAYHDGGGWISETVDSSAELHYFSRPSLALDSAGRPHVAYDNYDGASWRLKYAWWDGAQWQTEVADSHESGLHATMSLDPAGRAHVGYLGLTGLRYAQRMLAPTPPITFTWNLGDGILADGEVITHTYDLPGTYTVVLTATNCQGQGVATATHTITVEALPCEPVQEADFAWLPLTPTAGVPVTFTAQASGTLPITFTWDLGDGTFAEGEVVSYTYGAPGTYTVILTATNCATSTATVAHTVTVAAPCIPPVAVTVEGPTSLLVGQAGHYTSTVSPVTATLPITFTWDNGTVGSTAVYTWTSPGTYTMVVTATNPCAMTVTVSYVIEVHAEVRYTIYLPLVVRGY